MLQQQHLCLYSHTFIPFSVIAVNLSTPFSHLSGCAAALGRCHQPAVQRRTLLHAAGDARQQHRARRAEAGSFPRGVDGVGAGLDL